MKIIIFLTTTFILSSCIVFSQVDTSLKEFYPLKLGNLWQYRDQDNTLSTERVVKEDTILPNGKHYFYIKGYDFVRIDSALRILVYGGDPFDDCDTNNEYSIYRLNEPVGSIWKICHNWIDALCGPPYFMQYAGVTQLSNTKETVNILGVESEIMRFYPGVYCYSENDTMWFYGDWLLARGLGIIREETIEGRYRYLTGAIIDGVTYGTIVAVEDIPETIPSIFLLEQNYPNPFNPSTIIEYQLPTKSHVTIEVFDLLGREISILVDEVRQAGTHKVRWNTSSVPAGVYFYKMTTDKYMQTKKMLLIR